MNKIIQHLFLGDIDDARNLKRLNRKEIDVIVNCAKELKNYYPDTFVYYRLDWHDDPSQSLTKLDNIVNKIIRLLDNHYNVFVHCAAGVSRSATVVIAVIMKMYGMGYREAYKYVKSRRRIVNPNGGFKKYLSQLAA